MSKMVIQSEQERQAGERITNDILWWLSNEANLDTDQHIADWLGVNLGTWQSLKQDLPWDLVTAVRIAEAFGMRVTFGVDW